MMNIINAKEGMWLTQAQELDDNQRLYCKEVALGKGDKEENWRDASDEEYEEWYARMEAIENLANDDEEFY